MLNRLKNLFWPKKHNQIYSNKIMKEEKSVICSMSHHAAVDVLGDVDKTDKTDDEYLVLYNEMLIMFRFLSTKLYIKHSFREWDEIDAVVELSIFQSKLTHGQLYPEEQQSIARFVAAACYGYNHEAGHYIESNDRQNFAAACLRVLFARLRKYHGFDTNRLNREEISTGLVTAYGALDGAFENWPDLLRMARESEQMK